MLKWWEVITEAVQLYFSLVIIWNSPLLIHFCSPRWSEGDEGIYEVIIGCWMQLLLQLIATCNLLHLWYPDNCVSVGDSSLCSKAVQNNFDCIRLARYSYLLHLPLTETEIQKRVCRCVLQSRWRVEENCIFIFTFLYIAQSFKDYFVFPCV